MIETISFILAALVGVMIGINLNRLKIERKSHKQLEKLNHSYFKGLNYLLNDDSEKAIDVFIELAKSSSETFEPQLALGNLYRRKGEVDKAIKLHQSLISQPNQSSFSDGKRLHERRSFGSCRSFIYRIG